MQHLSLMTDSVAGIPKELAARYRITVVPTAHIMYDGHTYIDGVTINAMEAYQLLRLNPDKFNTSAISPGYLLNTYRELSRQSQEILFITLSSALSAVSRSAALAAELLQKESPGTTIHILDSKTVASGEGLLVLAAAKTIAQGMTLEEVVSFIGKAREKTGTIILFDTLRYAYRTGRVPKLASLVGSMLGVKLLTRVSENGELHPAGVARTTQSGTRRLLEIVREEAKTDSLHFMIMHADASEAAEALGEVLKREFHCLSMVITEFSPVMGYGSGPGALAVGFHPDLEFPYKP